MDPRLLKYYNQELQYMREMGGEFAKEFPKIASRLGLDSFECADPYVERLLEGFSFLAARVQLKIDAEYPRFTQHLLEMIYPHYLSPVPSMAIVQFQPNKNEGSLSKGFVIPRHSVLRSLMGKDVQTACEYRTAHDVTLWPVELAKAEYISNAGSLSINKTQQKRDIKAGIRFKIRTTAGLTFNRISLNSLTFFLRGSDELPMRIFERLLANSVCMIVRPSENPEKWQEEIDNSYIKRVGFESNRALLPYSARSFHGYRLLQEYFAFPERFMFVELGGLGQAVSRSSDTELEIIVLFNRSDPSMENLVDTSHFVLNCSPAINLFSRRADRIHLSDKQTEYHVIPDRTRPMDLEVHSITSVVGHGTGTGSTQEFLPFYSSSDINAAEDHNSYYTIHRKPRLISTKQRGHGTRSGYVGNEIFISLVDNDEGPYRSDLRQLAITALCTNRDLPIHMPIGKGSTDFTMESGAMVESVRCIAGPTTPKPSHTGDETAWRLISHLSLNYLSLTDNDEKKGAAGLRDMLSLYGDSSEAAIRKQIAGVGSISSKPVTRHLPTAGRLSFGRGLEITVTFDESAFEGTGVFLLGAVLEQFFTKYVSINSFTETVIRSIDRGEIIRWPIQSGLQQIL